MAFFSSVLFSTCVVLALQGLSDALSEITCLSFEKDFLGSRGVWVGRQNVQRVDADCPSGNRCARFSRRTRSGSSLYIPRFASSFSAWRSFTLSFWFKTSDDKTSLLFHNDNCYDHGSLTLTIYNAGMLIAEIELDNKKTSMTVAFMSRNDWHHVAVVFSGRDVKIYVDAKLKDVSPLSGGRIYNTACPLVVAGRPKKLIDDVVPYIGYMDQICMYGRALSPMQVKDLYENPYP